MKILIPGVLVALMATAAVAQTVTPAEPAAPMEAAPPAEAVAPVAPAADGMLVQKDGKWWNGDREATKTEIAAYKKAKKAGKKTARADAPDNTLADAGGKAAKPTKSRKRLIPNDGSRP